MVGDATGSRTYHYDDLDSITRVTTGFANTDNAYTVGYTFYNDGQAATMTTPAGQSSFQYDTVGRLTNLSDPVTGPFSWTYFDSDWLMTQLAPNILGSNYGRESDGTLSESDNRGSFK